MESKNAKLYEILDAVTYRVLFVGTSKEVDEWLENPDHNEYYEIREVKNEKQRSDLYT